MDEADKPSSNPQQLNDRYIKLLEEMAGVMISSGITIQVAFQIEKMMMKF